MLRRPLQGLRQFLARLRLMEPKLVFRDDQRRTHQPYARFPFLNENLTSREFLSQRNLAIGPNDLYGCFAFKTRFHIYLSPTRACRESENMPRADCTIAL